MLTSDAPVRQLPDRGISARKRSSSSFKPSRPSFLPTKMAPSAKTTSTKHKFVVDYSRPAGDGVFDGADFEKFLHDRIKVDNKAGQLGDNVKIVRDASNKITVTSTIPFSKRYLKYLTKKFLKKNSLRDWIRVVASSKDVYQLRFYNIARDGEEEEEE
ncbi:ribosomal L22e protein family-domain-containing protein [Melanogaster broomeanus]|nr:ribosomal L22e protein family-domain-containing protein [Melanogaster broomeanus]